MSWVINFWWNTKRLLKGVQGGIQTCTAQWLPAYFCLREQMLLDFGCTNNKRRTHIHLQSVIQCSPSIPHTYDTISHSQISRLARCALLQFWVNESSFYTQILSYKMLLQISQSILPRDCTCATLSFQWKWWVVLKTRIGILRDWSYYIVHDLQIPIFPARY